MSTWIGLEQIGDSDKFIYADRVEADNGTAWESNEPNSHLERCVEARGRFSFALNDESCTTENYCLCEL